jgi:outer membrane receptor for ferrienterochelin and colicins
MSSIWVCATMLRAATGPGVRTSLPIATAPDLRLDEINDEFKVHPFVSAFIEHKDVAGFTVRAEMRNIAKMQDALDRTVFVNRRNGPIDFIESRRRGFGHIFRVTISGTL